jgi:hypothetical protein
VLANAGPDNTPLTGEIAIAAHADVFVDGGLDALEDALPATAKLTVAFTGGDSYFNSTVSNTGEPFDGTYDGWCIDTQGRINPGTTYDVNVFSSYEDAAEDHVDVPGNLDLVNWIINQGFFGSASPSGGTYSMGDIQKAIWVLIDDGDFGVPGPWSPVHVQEIVDAALASGEGFVPGCGEVVAVILVPVNGQQVTIAQVTFIEVGVPCEDREETAWGGNWNGTAFEEPFNGGSWAGWFPYTTDAA